MTAAYRLKGAGWLGGCVAVTFACYLVSSQVTTERKRLDDVNTKIASAERDVRALETEFDTRASLSQLERWNGETLSLVAPAASQFIGSEAQLASISFDGPTPQAGMRTASLVVPAFTVQAEPTIAPTAPTAPTAAKGTVMAKVELVKTAAVKAASRPAPVIVAAAAPVRSAAAKASALPAIVASIGKPVVRKPQAVAMLDRALLSESTLGDLMSGARGESGRLR